MKQVPPLDLYLAATMQPSADLTRRLRDAGVTDVQLERARETARAAGIGEPLSLRKETIQRLFGPGVGSATATLRYDLVLWPEHQFDWHIMHSGGASFGGFRLRVPDVSLPGLDAAGFSWRCYHHTSHEVSALLGPPNEDLTWGIWGHWLYADRRNGTLSFEFDYGLLRTVSAKRHANPGS